jgi:hypothetical protein
MNPDGSVTMCYKLTFTRAPRGRMPAALLDKPKVQAKPAVTLRPVIDPCSVPRLTRLLVLGHRLEQLVRNGVVPDYTQLARICGISKGRVTHLVNLTLLAPDIQNDILRLGTSDIRSQRLFERTLRPVTALVDWNEQRSAVITESF